MRIKLLVLAVVAAMLSVISVQSVLALTPLPCENCGASEFAPGQEAQEAGIIGPEIPGPCPSCGNGDFGN